MATDIAISDDKIAGIGSGRPEAEFEHLIDASGLVVLPGIIDVHLHLGHGNDISRPRQASDAASETGAAAAGGVTAMIPYIYASEPYSERLLQEVIDITEAGARIDFGYHLVISTPDQLAEVQTYVERFGIPSFKIFMNNRMGEGKRLGLPDIDDGFLYQLIEKATAAGGMVCPHPENIEIAQYLRAGLMASDPDGAGGLALWNRSRPPIVEADAIQRAAIITKELRGQLYLVHTSSGEALEAALRMRRAGTNLHIETCVQYLTHNVDWEGGHVGKVNPPLREAADNRALWEAVRNGDIDTIATDHVHRPLSAKDPNIWKGSPGFPGMETLLPVMLSEGYHKRGIALSRISDLLSGNPARRMGLTAKGTIAVGKDADLVLVDLEGETRVRNKDVRSDAGYSIYDGWTLKGRVAKTIARGKVVYEDAQLVDDAVGRGRYVARTLGPA